MQWRQSQLALGDGGLGLRRRGGVSPAIQFWSSWAATAPWVTQVLCASGLTPPQALSLIQADCSSYAPQVLALLTPSDQPVSRFLTDPSSSTALDALTLLDAAAAVADRTAWLAAAPPRDAARLHMNSG